LTQTTYDDTTTTTYSYDGPGNLTGVTDQANNTVNYTYDYANQLRSVIQTASPNPENTTSYQYDPDGNLTNLTDANTHTTLNGFDFLGQLNLEAMPAGQQQTRTYDAAGNLQTLTDYNGKTTTFAYDTLNRLMSRTPDPSLPDTPESFTYTATGKRATMTDASGTTIYTYDAQDRLQTKATPQGTLTYTYDTAGNVASMTSSNANGVSVGYTYDSLNRLATVVDNRLPVGQNTTTYSYDPASNLATVTYPNGLQSQFTYDTLNRVTGLSNAAASYTYTLDGTVGNRKGVTEQLASKPNPRIVAWNYDNIYRLTNEDITADPNSKTGSVTYGLDPVGNRLSLGLSNNSSLPGISPILPGSISYDPDDRLNTETYDANGNTLTTAGKTFTYDFANRLKSMTEGTVAVTLAYDADGNRVAKTVGGTTTRYLVDDLNPTGYAQVVEEVTGTTANRTYTYGLQRISQTQQVANAWTPSFYGYDGGGTVRLLTDSTGTVTDTYDYDAWGNTVNTTGSTPNVYLYRGEQFDYDLGLYYLRARYFNPLTGRLLSRDPYAGEPPTPATLHKYLYANGDPVNLGDPSGMLVPTPTPAPPQAPPRTMAGTMTEYTLLVMAISSPFAVMLLPDGPVNMSAQEINCVWQWATGWLEMAAMRAMGQNVVPQYTKGQCGPTPKKCKPCPSNPKPRCDSVPPSRPHFPCKHDHIHFFYYYQDPVTCECHVNEWEPPTCLDPPMTCKNQGYGY
jgi:RHS repeat-associated protein